MKSVTFVVEFYEGRWRIDFDGDLFGSFPTRVSAEYEAVHLAHSTAELPTRVIVRDGEGVEEIVWDPCSLIDDLCEHLKSHRLVRLNSNGLRDQITRRVIQCAIPELSEHEIADIVLRSFGIESRWRH
jgi:hypothetical protein